MPDIGIGACVTRCCWGGNDQEVRLGTWEAATPKRLEEKVPMAWKPGVWYRMKLMATVEDGKGVIKGKVWPRRREGAGEVDDRGHRPIPNTHGAAHLYAGR